MEQSCLILAGEKSGEDHAMTFMRQLVATCPAVKFFGVGGEQLSQMGVELQYHLKDFSSWGIGEVIGKIPFYFKAMNHLISEVDRRGCKVAILVDFQDFNLRLAMKLKGRGVNVLYYVAPQAWGWRPGRAAVLGRTVHTLFTLIPFEKEWFRSRGVDRTVGVVHPVKIEHAREFENSKFMLQQKKLGTKKKILILPGSRNFEVRNLLPHFMQTIDRLSKNHELEISLVRTSSVEDRYYERFLKRFNRVYQDSELVEALKDCHVALAASGTVTLTCAVFGVPTVACYQAALTTEFVFNNIANYSGYMCLANIVHEAEVFPEHIQYDVQAPILARDLEKWLTSNDEYERIKSRLLQTVDKISGEDIDIPSYMQRVIKESYANA